MADRMDDVIAIAESADGLLYCDAVAPPEGGNSWDSFQEVWR